MSRIAYVSQLLGRGSAFGGGVVARTNLTVLRGLPGVELNAFALAADPVEGTYHVSCTPSRSATAWANLQGYSGTLHRPALTALVHAILRSEPDLVWLDTSLLGRCLAALRKQRPGLRVVTFLHNVEFDLQAARARHSPLYLIAAISDWMNERISVRQSDVLVTLHGRDSARIRSLYGRGADHHLPISLADDLAAPQEPAPAPQNGPLLFVGSLYAPNVEGVTFLVDKVMPHLEDRLVIVGRGLETLRGRLTRSNVQVVGTVDDLASHYRNARCVVAPIFSGGGMKVKVAEALMHGRPVVATPQALIGYEAVSHDNCTRAATTADQFIAALRGGFDSGAGTRARTGYLRHFSLEAASRRAEVILSTATGAHEG